MEKDLKDIQNQRIRDVLFYLYEKKGVNKTEIASKIGYSNSAAITNIMYSEDRGMKPVHLHKLYEEYNVNPAFIEDGTEPMILEPGEKPAKKYELQTPGRQQMRELEALYSKAPKKTKDYNVVVIDQIVTAGEGRGFAEPEVIESLPKKYDPRFGSSLHIETTVTGNSMENEHGGGLHHGDTVWAYKVRDLSKFQEGWIHVVVHAGGGVIKRIFKDEKHGGIICVSDNKRHKPFRVKEEDLYELWEIDNVLTNYLPPPEYIYDIAEEFLKED